MPTYLEILPQCWVHTPWSNQIRQHTPHRELCHHGTGALGEGPKRVSFGLQHLLQLTARCVGQTATNNIAQLVLGDLGRERQLPEDAEFRNHKEQ